MDTQTIILAVLGSSVMVELIRWILGRIDKKNDVVHQKDINPIKQACMAIIQDRLEWQMTKYIREGEVTPNQAKAVSTLMNAYEGLGGDSFIHTVYDQFKEVPLSK